MASKKVNNNWLSEEYSANERKVPTLRQYLKELPKDVKDIKSTVRIIWLPGRWNNYTLQCDDFRVIVSGSSKLFSQLRDNVDDFTKGTQTLDVIVTDRTKVSYRLNLNPEEHGEWFFIGSQSGLRFTRNDSDVGDADNIPF